MNKIDLSSGKQIFYIFLLLLLVFVIVASLTFSKRQELKADLQSKKSELEQLVSYAEKIHQIDYANKQEIRSGDDRTLATRISEVIKGQGINGMQFTTQSQNKIKVRVEDVSFLKIHKSLNILEENWGIQVESATIKKADTDTTDKVNVTLLLSK